MRKGLVGDRASSLPLAPFLLPLHFRPARVSLNPWLPTISFQGRTGADAWESHPTVQACGLVAMVGDLRAA